MNVRVTTPAWGRAAAWMAVLMCALALPAAAQPPKRTPADKPAATPAKPDAATPAKKGPVKEQNFNFGELGLSGRTRSPQLLYFLERANEELERASLEKRSFIPHLVRTVEEEAL